MASRNQETSNSSHGKRSDSCSIRLHRISAPWGRGSSEYRPGLFIKKYFHSYGEVCAADIFVALDDEINRLNDERIQIGETPIRRPNYNSFARYFHWFFKMGLIERTGKRAPAIYKFLKKRVFYKLTDKGQAEIRAWEDPIAVIHPEFRKNKLLS